MFKPKVSIITVCLNSIHLIEKTMQSVIDQDYPNIEYIIKDGKSEDGTLNIINDYYYQNRNKMKVISQKDSGIYHAMNQGFNQSTGKYLLFLNAGDYLWRRNTLTNLTLVAENKKADFIYGRVFLGKNKYKNSKIYTMFELIFKTICHQGILASRRCFQDNMFDENYKWLSDYQWVLNCFNNKMIKKSFVDDIIAYFDPENRTNLNDVELKRQRFMERISIGEKHFKGIYKVVFLFNQKRLESKFSINSN